VDPPSMPPLQHQKYNLFFYKKTLRKYRGSSINLFNKKFEKYGTKKGGSLNWAASFLYI
jgi:hypothetical protein